MVPKTPSVAERRASGPEMNHSQKTWGRHIHGGCRLLCRGLNLDLDVPLFPVLRKNCTYLLSEYSIACTRAFQILEQRSGTTHRTHCTPKEKASKGCKDADEAVKERPFALTSHALRLLEQVALAVRLAEPVLLVGETGTGRLLLSNSLLIGWGTK
jgi:hypothetical protein